MLEQWLTLRSATKYFKNYKLDYPNTETQKGSRKFVKAMKKLHVRSAVHLLPPCAHIDFLQETIPPHTEFNRKFLDLLRRIFVYDPKKRISAKDALRHPWFQETLMDDGTEAHKIRQEREKKLRQRQEEERRLDRYQQREPRGY